MAIGTITHCFTNVGNDIPHGRSPEARREVVRGMLKVDDGLWYDEQTDSVDLIERKPKPE